MISTRTFLVAVGLFLGVILLLKGMVKPLEMSYATAGTERSGPCLAYMDTTFKDRLAKYQKLSRQVIEQGPVSRTAIYFPGFDMGSAHISPNSGQHLSACLRFFYLDSDQVPTNSLEATGRAYIAAFDALRPEAEAIEAFYVQRAPDIDVSRARQLDAAFEQRLRTLQQAEIPFRRAFEKAQLQLREQQLAQIEQRFGHDQHWYTLKFMLLARSAMDQVDEGTITATELAMMQDELQHIWQAAHIYHQAYPHLSSVGGSQAVWLDIEPLSQRWLEHLGNLQQQWSAKAKPVQLDMDLHIVQQDYDQLLAQYNAKVGSRY
ncbi:DUF3829 domain-containing protein [Pseudomonas oryzihabitans]|uniref:DUF3829 domain-containing protein n=1 Tax=Pseudomonas oryzihabitans TaxID=47885 RepID=UPI00111CF55E|nr:DUF3829 domain-containing protein [Pseudomonas psychrotolerans]QDD90648.1 hypothetical protein CCZ28_17150 [Pseudomonas psychrotolerans]